MPRRSGIPSAYEPVGREEYLESTVEGALLMAEKLIELIKDKEVGRISVTKPFGITITMPYHVSGPVELEKD